MGILSLPDAKIACEEFLCAVVNRCGREFHVEFAQLMSHLSSIRLSYLCFYFVCAFALVCIMLEHGLIQNSSGDMSELRRLGLFIFPASSIFQTLFSLSLSSPYWCLFGQQQTEAHFKEVHGVLYIHPDLFQGMSCDQN